MSQTFTPVEGVDMPYFKTAPDAKSNLKRLAIFTADGCDQHFDYNTISDGIEGAVMRVVNLNDNMQFTTYSGEKYQICRLDYNLSLSENEFSVKIKLLLTFLAVVMWLAVVAGIYFNGIPIGWAVVCTGIVLASAYNVWDHIKTEQARKKQRKAIFGRTTDWRARAILERYI
jgi:hypothetical protein